MHTEIDIYMKRSISAVRKRSVLKEVREASSMTSEMGYK